jgi:hypothetical protein
MLARFRFLRDCISERSRHEPAIRRSSKTGRATGGTTRLHFEPLRIEALEDRRLLSATIGTDRPDYVPGGIALIRGSGFQPGETVQLQVLHTEGTANAGPNESPWQVSADGGSGSLRASWNLDPADAGSFEIIAIGKTSGAIATNVFADSIAYTNPIVPAAASVATDRSDYVPGSTAIIAASGFSPGETVQFQVLRTDGGTNAPSDHAPWLVSDVGGAGNVQTTWYVDPIDSAGASLRAIAIGQSSGEVATADFTDSVTGVTPSSIPEGSAQFVLLVAGSGFNTGTSQVVWTPSGGSPVTLTKSGAQSSTQLRVLVPASLVTDEGTADVAVTGPGAGGSATFTITDTDSLTVTAQPFTPLLNTPYAGTVATVADTYENMADLTATIDWGDGQQTSGVLTEIYFGYYAVSDGGSHVYTNFGDYPVSVTVSDDPPGTATANDTNTASVVAAAVAGIAATAAPGNSYAAGYEYDVTVTFSAPVDVDTSGGTPTILLNAYNENTFAPEYATYSSGSGTDTLTFAYVVQPGDVSSLLDYTTANDLTTNGGTITSGGNPVSLTLPDPGSANDGVYSNSNVIDTEAPTVSYLFAYPDPTNTSPTVDLGVSDNYDFIVAGEYFIDAPGIAGSGTPLTVAFPGYFADAIGTVDITGLSDGQHTVYADARDAAGNWSAQASYTITIDTQPPVVTSLSVQPSPTPTAPTLSATFADNDGLNDYIAAAEYFLDTPGPAGTGTPLPVGFDGTTYSATDTVAGSLTDGTHTVYVDAEDGAGNWSAQVSQTFVMDSHIPTVTIAPPAAVQTNQSPLTFTVTFDVPVAGLNASSFSSPGAVVNGVVTAVTPVGGSQTVYTVEVTPDPTNSPTGEVVSLQVPAGAAYNPDPSAGGEQNVASNTVSVTFDNVAPTLTSVPVYGSYPSSYPVGTIVGWQGSYQVGLVFSENVVVTGSPVLHLANGQTEGLYYVTGNTVVFSPIGVGQGQTSNGVPLDFAGGVYLTGGTIADAAGNGTVLPAAGPGDPLVSQDVTIDGIPPIITLTPLSNTAPFTFQITSNKPLAGAESFTGSWFNGTFLSGSVTNVVRTAPSTFTFQISPPSNGTTVSIQAVAGNVVYGYAVPSSGAANGNYSNTAAVVAGTTLPSVSLDAPSNGTTGSPLSFAGSYGDNGGTAISQVQLTIIGTNVAYPTHTYAAAFAGNAWSYSIPAGALATGSYTAYVTASNAAGDVVASGPLASFTITDTTPPVTTASTYTQSGIHYNPASPNSYGWFTSSGSIDVLLSANDFSAGNSGIAATYYTLDGQPQLTYTSGTYIAVTGNGPHSITYWSVDGANNIETAHTLPINIDTAIPTVSVNLPPTGAYGVPMTFSGTWSDNVSGVSRILVSVYDFVAHYSFITIADTSPATLNFSGGGGSGAAATVATTNGVVTGVSITNGGSGYTTPPTVTFSTGADTTATGTAILTGGVVTGVIISDGGSGYASTVINPDGTWTFTFTPTTAVWGNNVQAPVEGSNWMAAITPISGSGVSGNSIFSDGGGNVKYTSPPTVGFSGGGGSNAAATAILTDGFVTSVIVSNGGSGYTSPPTVTFSGGGGFSATGTAIISGGVVTGVSVTPAIIGQASSVTTVTVGNAVYDGNPHGGTASVTGVGGLNQALTVYYVGINGTLYASSTVAPSNAGQFEALASFAGDANHAGSSGFADFSISPATLDIYAATDSKTYDGTTTSVAAPTFQVASEPLDTLYGSDTLTGLVQAFASKNVLGSGTSTLNVQPGYSLGDGNGGANYQVILHSASGTINPATLDVYATTDSKTYDGATTSAAAPTFQVANKPLDTLYSSDALTGLVQAFASKHVLGAGLSTLNVQPGYSLGDGNGGNNYQVVLHSAAGTINPATLTITANDRTKAFGAPVPTLTYSVVGLVNPDTLIANPAISTAVTATTPVGVYVGAIHIGGAQASSDYTIAYINGTMTVTPDVPTIGSVVVVLSRQLITWNVQDHFGVRSSGLSIDGKALSPIYGPFAAASGVNYSAHFGGLPTGTHNYTITAINTLGYSSQYTGSFVVIGPTIGSVIVATSRQLITWNVQDAVGITGSGLSVDGKKVPQIYGPFAAASGVNYAGHFGGLAAGTHNYTITATDTLGNSSQYTGSFVVAGPTISSVVIVAAKGLMTWNVQDAAGVASSALVADGKSVSQIYGPFTAASGVNYAGRFGILPVGTHNYTITATNTLGNYSQYSGQFTVSALLADLSVAPAALAAPLTDRQLAPIVMEAERRLTSAEGPQSLTAMSGATVQVANLPSGRLAETIGKTILVDRKAAGYGWFVDPTPRDDLEFADVLGQHAVAATADIPAATRVDLLTAVMHEMGHVLGYGHDAGDDLMNTILPLGIRRALVANQD